MTPLHHLAGVVLHLHHQQGIRTPALDEGPRRWRHNSVGLAGNGAGTVSPQKGSRPYRGGGRQGDGTRVRRGTLVRIASVRGVVDERPRRAARHHHVHAPRISASRRRQHRRRHHQPTRTLRRPRPAGHVGGIRGQNDLVNDKTIFPHPNVNGVKPRRPHIHRGHHPVHGRLRPRPARVKTRDPVRTRHRLTVQTHMHRVVHRTRANTTHPHIVRPRLHKIDVKTQPRTHPNVARVVVGPIVGLRTQRARPAVPRRAVTNPRMTPRRLYPVVVLHLDGDPCCSGGIHLLFIGRGRGLASRPGKQQNRQQEDFCPTGETMAPDQDRTSRQEIAHGSPFPCSFRANPRNDTKPLHGARAPSHPMGWHSKCLQSRIGFWRLS